jgi:transposase
MQGKKDYQEKLFMNFQLSDRVPAENFYRRLKEQLDLSFLYKETKKYYGSEGQQSIDPVVFFKLILIGYLENLNSNRRIISHVSMRMDLLFFIGYDLDEELPWHSTLSRTRSLYGEEVFKKLFQKVLELCILKGMVSGKRQAVDSAYIKANASMDSLLEKQILEDGEAYTEEIREEDQTVSAQKKKEVERHHAWKEKAYKDRPGGKKKPEEGIESKFYSNYTHYSATDPDARISVKPGKPRQLNYSAQTSVDTRTHVITHITADFADKRDSQSLPEVVKGIRRTFSRVGLELKEVLADTGYSSGQALKFLNFHRINAYIPNFGQYKPEREGFIFNPEKEQYECLQGNKAILPLKKIAKTERGYYMKTYRSSAKDCGNCPLRSTCIGKTDFKKLDDTLDKPFYDAMHRKMQTPKAKRMMKLRQSTVEPVLGTLINFLGMRRIWTRGIASANKFMLGAAIAYNLKKWLNYKEKKIESKVNKRFKGLQFRCSASHSLWLSIAPYTKGEVLKPEF